VEKMVAQGVVSHCGPQVPFIGREMEQRGREAGGQAPVDGAPLTYRLLEEETMRWPFDEGEMKRR
jgi:hypothetical protein